MGLMKSISPKIASLGIWPSYDRLLWLLVTHQPWLALFSNVAGIAFVGTQNKRAAVLGGNLLDGCRYKCAYHTYGQNRNPESTFHGFVSCIPRRVNRVELSTWTRIIGYVSSPLDETPRNNLKTPPRFRVDASQYDHNQLLFVQLVTDAA